MGHSSGNRESSRSSVGSIGRSRGVQTSGKETKNKDKNSNLEKFNKKSSHKTSKTKIRDINQKFKKFYRVINEDAFLTCETAPCPNVGDK